MIALPIDYSSPEYQAEFKLQRRLDRAGLNKSVNGHAWVFANKTLANFQTPTSAHRETLASVHAWIKSWDGKQGIGLAGNVGIGKTHLAAGITREIVLAGHDARFWNCADLLAAMRDEFEHPPEDGEESKLQDAKTVAFLAIDDMGAEKASDWTIEQLYLLINYRSEYSLPTLFTTNLRYPDRFREHFRPRIHSRLEGVCQVIVPKITDDWRLGHA